MNINPLQIPRVLQEVLGNLKPHQLKTCRLVNTFWNHESLSILREKDHLHFNSFREIIRFVDSYEDFNLQDSLEYKNAFPFKKCIFGSPLFDNTDPNFFGFSDASLNFFERFGQFITKVHLNLNNSEKSHEILILKHLLKSLLEIRLPNLETLSLLVKGCSDKIYDEGTILPKIKKFYITCSGYDEKNDLNPLISSFLKSFINLETISCKNSFKFHHNEGNFLNQMNCRLNDSTLKSILSNAENLKCLSKIEVLLKLNNNDLQSFTKIFTSNQLQMVYIEIDNSVENSSLSEFLLTFRKSLRDLYLEFQTGLKTVIEFNGFIMTNLEKITLVNYHQSLNFLRGCPTIKSIFVNHTIVVGNVLKLEDFRGSVESLREFSLSCKFAMGIPHLGSTLEIFPCLSTLYLDNVKNDAVRGIFEHFKNGNLTALTIKGDEITNGAICGENDEILRILLDSALENYLEDKSWEFHPRFPSVCDLKNIQYLTIESNLITDACLALAISKCYRLRNLILNSKLELITKFGFMKLRSLKNLEYLEVFVRQLGWMNLNNLMQ